MGKRPPRSIRIRQLMRAEVSDALFAAAAEPRGNAALDLLLCPRQLPQSWQHQKNQVGKKCQVRARMRVCARARDEGAKTKGAGDAMAVGGGRKRALAMGLLLFPSLFLASSGEVGQGKGRG